MIFYGTGNHKIIGSDLECIRYKLKNQQVIFEVKSSREKVPCPYCGKVSSKIHSVYQREIQDIPIQDKQTIVLLNTRKMFCSNPACDHKTFLRDLILLRPGKGKQNGLLIKYY